MPGYRAGHPGDLPLGAGAAAVHHPDHALLPDRQAVRQGARRRPQALRERAGADEQPPGPQHRPGLAAARGRPRHQGVRRRPGPSQLRLPVLLRLPRLAACCTRRCTCSTPRCRARATTGSRHTVATGSSNMTFNATQHPVQRPLHRARPAGPLPDLPADVQPDEAGQRLRPAADPGRQRRLPDDLLAPEPRRTRPADAGAALHPAAPAPGAPATAAAPSSTSTCTPGSTPGACAFARQVRRMHAAGLLRQGALRLHELRRLQAAAPGPRRRGCPCGARCSPHNGTTRLRLHPLQEPRRLRVRRQRPRRERRVDRLEQLHQRRDALRRGDDADPVPRRPTSPTAGSSGTSATGCRRRSTPSSRSRRAAAARRG